ncbi:MAG TPA: UDP-glucose/GDP-mannose dehydrogenase family protein, partial [Anaerolineae bacterium]|nr:UDP-glucose/GDP-mannose dehydrogenase family protein [Anaerolineae bacterium]
VSDVQVYDVTDQWVYSMETDNHVIVGPTGVVTSNCFPKDVKALEHMALMHGAHPQLLRAVMDINRDQRRKVIHTLRELLGGHLRDRVVGLLGLAFKPNTDDMREAPAVEIAHLLDTEGAIVKGYDPVAMASAKRELPYVQLASDPYDLAQGCDALVVCTEWNEFKHLDMPRIRQAMRCPVIIDGRNIYDPEAMYRHGFVYRGIGRGQPVPSGNNDAVPPELVPDLLAC